MNEENQPPNKESAPRCFLGGILPLTRESAEHYPNVPNTENETNASQDQCGWNRSGGFLGAVRV